MEVPHAPGCTPRMYAADSLPARYGSSEMYSKIAAARRAALDVDGGSQQDADILGLALVAQNLTHISSKRSGVKAGTGGAPGREADSLDAVVQAEVVLHLPAAPDRAGRRSPSRQDAQPARSPACARNPSRSKGWLFFQCHLADQCFQIALHILFSCLLFGNGIVPRIPYLLFYTARRIMTIWYKYLNTISTKGDFYAARYL